MRILYVFPHPDDESFGPARVMSHERRQGHEVFLLTLTRGGATRQRHRFGYSVEEMGRVRYVEMLEVAKILDLSGMEVLDMPDSGLKELDPRDIERAVLARLERLKPHAVVTYPVHGISGFHDHLVTHAVVKRAFEESSPRISNLQRLAFYTITQDQAKEGYFSLSGSTDEEIDCIHEVEQEDVENGIRALDCYVTFQETIEKTGIKKHIGRKACFEFYRQTCDPPVPDLVFGLT